MLKRLLSVAALIVSVMVAALPAEAAGVFQPKFPPVFNPQAGKARRAAAGAVIFAPYSTDFTGTTGTVLTGQAIGDKTWAVDQSATGSASPLILNGNITGQVNSNSGSSGYNLSQNVLDLGVSASKWYRMELTSHSGAAAWFGGSGSQPSVFWLDETFTGTGSNWNWIGASNTSAHFPSIASYINHSAISNAATAELYHSGSVGYSISPVLGDVWEIHKFTSGGHVYLQPFLNGQRIGADIQIDTISGLTINDKFGINGYVGSAGYIDGVMVGDPAVHGMLTAYVGRTPQMELANAANPGRTTLRISGLYSGNTPPSLTVTLYKATDDTVISGYSGITLTNYSTGPPHDIAQYGNTAAAPSGATGSYTGTITIAASTIPATGAYARVTRSDLSAASGGLSTTTSARTGTFVPGYNTLWEGQSLSVKAWCSGSSATGYTASTVGWNIDGSADNSCSPSQFNGTPVNFTSHNQSWAISSTLFENGFVTSFATALVNNLAGATIPQSHIRGGYGATYYIQRQQTDPTSAGLNGIVWNTGRDGIALAGDSASFAFEAGGEYETVGAASATLNGGTAYSGSPTNIGTYIKSIYDSFAASTGRTPIVFIRPVGAVYTTSDGTGEQVRRAQWEMTQLYPTQYFLAGYSMEGQHDNGGAKIGGQYHLTDYTEQTRRFVYAEAKYMGWTTFDLTGPKINGVVAYDANSVTVQIKKNGTGTIEMTNSGNPCSATSVSGRSNLPSQNDYRGGLRFSLSSTFGTLIYPTSMSITDAPGGDATLANIVFQFTTGSITSAPYVSGPYGHNPFNPEDDTIVTANMATCASMIQQVYTSMPFPNGSAATGTVKVPVQPYYNDTTGDYVHGFLLLVFGVLRRKPKAANDDDATLADAA